ncbi:MULTISPECIES: hypothetical protein [unclassified Bradyrhizobium]|uniref:hypothetical protein n=1 Tax=unclassified Bradyrhizobium TaxID=2631580 RepID=UPI0028EAD55E|nr:MULTISPECIES: hypothetical protein [unclassified Bradyrhizobium]
MRIRTRWPWITALVSVALLANPLGIDVIHSAFFSGEALSRGIWAPIVLAGFAICAVLMLLEAIIRALIWRRSVGSTTTI